MILKTAEIKKFLNEASIVKVNITAPNLTDLIKIESAAGQIIFTKTNLNVFCSYTIEDAFLNIDDECYLVGERSLTGLAQTTKSDTLTIKQAKDMIYIKGADTECLQMPAEHVNMYPQIPESGGEEISIDSEVLYCIKLAGNFVNTDQKITAASFVHVDSHGVFSTNNNNIIYYHKFDGLPNIFFSADALQVIRPINGATYSMHGNFDFLNYQGFRFGVLKSGIIEKGIDYSRMIAGEGIFNFEINRQDLLDYCTLINYTAKSGYPFITLTYNGESLFINHDDADFNIHVNKQYKCLSDGEPIEKFNFCIKYFDLFLKHLPYEKLIFSTVGNHIRVTTSEDADYVGIFAGQAQ